MERCANTEALAKYEREQEKAEKLEEQFVEEVDEEIYSLWEDMEEAYNVIAKRYDADENLFEYIKRNW